MYTFQVCKTVKEFRESFCQDLYLLVNFVVRYVGGSETSRGLYFITMYKETLPSNLNMVIYDRCYQLFKTLPAESLAEIFEPTLAYSRDTFRKYGKEQAHELPLIFEDEAIEIILLYSDGDACLPDIHYMTLPTKSRRLQHQSQEVSDNTAAQAIAASVR